MRRTTPSPTPPRSIAARSRPIPTAVPGVQVSELLPGHARILDKVSIIRSLHHDNGDHFAAAHWMLTGYLGSNAINTAAAVSFRRIDRASPDAGGLARSGMPAYVGLPRTHSVGLGAWLSWCCSYLGSAHNPFIADGNPSSEKYQVPNLSLPAGVDATRLLGRRRLMGMLPRRPAGPRISSGLMEDFDRFEQEAFSMVLGKSAREAFDLRAEDPRLRDRYSRHQWGQ